MHILDHKASWYGVLDIRFLSQMIDIFVALNSEPWDEFNLYYCIVDVVLSHEAWIVKT